MTVKSPGTAKRISTAHPHVGESNGRRMPRDNDLHPKTKAEYEAQEKREAEARKIARAKKTARSQTEREGLTTELLEVRKKMATGKGRTVWKGPHVHVEMLADAKTAKAAPQPSQGSKGFVSAMEALDRVKVKNQELDERISQLLGRLT